MRFFSVDLQPFSARHHPPPQRLRSLSCPALWPPGSQALSLSPRLLLLLLLLDQPVCVRCSDGPGLSGSAVIRWCLKRGDARRRVRGLRRRRPYHSAGIPSAPGAIRSQAEGGMPLSSKSQTGQRGREKKKQKKPTPIDTRVCDAARAPARPAPAKRVKNSEKKIKNNLAISQKYFW